MSLGLPAQRSTSVTSPRRPSADEVRRIAEELQKWARATPNVGATSLFTHLSRPTVRCAINSLNRNYDPALDDAVTELDLSLAQDPDLAGVDIEARLFFAASPDQIAAWARGWEPVSDA